MHYLEDMKIFVCESDWESMLTCMYVAANSHVGLNNLRLEKKSEVQYSLFDDYVQVDRDKELANKVMDAVCRKISPCFYEDMAITATAYESDALDIIYRVMMLGFNKGPAVLKMVQYREVVRFNEIQKRVGGEAHHFREFLRFSLVGNSVYVAHIEPKSRILLALAGPFIDRMPSEHWMIVDDVHKEALIHPKDGAFFIRTLTDEELNELLCTENSCDEYTDMWKVFFDTIAIKERANSRCQTNLFPKWLRKHAVEFNCDCV